VYVSVTGWVVMRFRVSVHACVGRRARVRVCVCVCAWMGEDACLRTCVCACARACVRVRVYVERGGVRVCWAEVGVGGCLHLQHVSQESSNLGVTGFLIE
jgi:hypothetical protein